MSEQTPAPAEGKPLDLESVFDVGSERTAYRPLRVRFRGQEYVFGASALSVLRALTIDGAADLEQREGETPIAYTARVLVLVPRMVEALCPGFPLGPWTVDEELDLFRATMEVLRRVGRIRFQAA